MKKTTIKPRFWLIPDALWEKLEPLLPKHINHHRFGGGRPRVPDRNAMNGIFFVLRTGCQWNALNVTGICSSSTAHLRFQEWRAAGVFEKFWELSLKEYEQTKGLKWRWQSMDGAMSKAPLGGKKNRTQPDGSGQKRGQAKHFVRRFGSSVGAGGGWRKSA
jgi:transposase